MLAIVRVTALCVLLTTCLQGQIPDAVVKPPEKDIELMDELRKRIEALPAERQEPEGLQILLDNVSQFESDHMRKRVYLSIAKLYERQGEAEKALVFFEKAGHEGEEIRDLSGVSEISRKRLLDLLEERGELSAVIEQALQYRDDPAVSDHEFAALTYKAGRALIKSGDADGGVELGIAAASERPCRDTFAKLETLAHGAATIAPRGKSDAYLNGMRWLHSNSGSFGQSARFLSNHSHCEEVSGNLAAAIAALEELVERHPESPDATASKLRLSRLSADIGDEVAAQEYLTQVIEGDGPAKYKEMARKSLELSTSTAPVTVTFPPPARESGGFTTFLIAHVVLFGGIAVVWWWVKRRPGKT